MANFKQILDAAYEQRAIEVRQFGRSVDKVLYVRLSAKILREFHELAESRGVSANTLARQLVLAELQRSSADATEGAAG